VLQGISSLQVCVAVNQFADDSIFQRNPFADQVKVKWISSLMSLRCSKWVRWWLYISAESVRLWGCVVEWISSLTSICITESVRWLVHASANPLADESALHRFSSLMSLWFSESVRRQGWVVQWIRSLASKCIIESARWLVFATPNPIADKVEVQRISFWRVFASENQLPHESVL
jgi:hypothetical protein